MKFGSTVYELVRGKYKYIRRFHYRRKILMVFFTSLLIVLATLIWLLLRMYHKQLDERKLESIPKHFRPVLQVPSMFRNILNPPGVNNTWEEIYSHSAVYSITGKRPTQEDRYAGQQTQSHITIVISD